MAQISVINFSDLSDTLRIDAEFYRPYLIEIFKILEKVKSIPLYTLAKVTDGQHGYFILDQNSEIRQITAQHVVNGFIEKDKADRLSSETHNKNLRSSLEEKDVLMSTVGTVGNIGVVFAEIPPANIDQNVARIKINDKKKMNPYYLAIFLMSEYGKTLISKFMSGQVQQRISLTNLRNFEIPLLDENFQKKIEIQFIKMHECYVFSKKSYAEAETLLLTELSLKDYKPKHQLSYNANRLESCISK